MQQPVTPLIVELTEPATEEITVADVLVGALSFTAVLVLVALMLALLFAGSLVALRRLRPTNSLNGDSASQTSLGLHLPPESAP